MLSERKLFKKNSHSRLHIVHEVRPSVETVRALLGTLMFLRLTAFIKLEKKMVFQENCYLANYFLL